MPEVGNLAAMLADLLATPGVEEILELRGQTGVLALHGGIEEETAAIAVAVAGRARASLYAVVQPEDLAWHVPSTRFYPAASARLRRFLEHVRLTVSFHGFGRRGLERTVLVGGANRPVARRMAAALRRATPLRVVDDLEAIPRELRGLHPANPVNLTELGGVQLEMSPGARAEDVRRGVVAAVAAVLVAEQRSVCAAAER